MQAAHPAAGRVLDPHAVPAASLRERLPSGRLTGPFATGPIRGYAKGLEAVFTERGEVDRQVDRAQDALADTVLFVS